MEIQDEDLEISVCPKCKGERVVWDPPESERRSGWRHQITCPECGGRGLKLTPTGAKLFDFVQQVTRYAR
jgi:uncharacterized protein YbaR (Trm112 family)